MITTNQIVESYSKRLDAAADQARAIRINAHAIFEAVEAKIDLERLLRRMAKDLRKLRLSAG